MKSAPEKNSIRFTAAVVSTDLLTLPKKVTAQLPSQEKFPIEGTINAFPFRSVIENQTLILSKPLQAAIRAKAGATITVEITRVCDEPEIRAPIELTEALAAAPKSHATWKAITPMARRDWILWITSGKQEETRHIRVKKACDMLASGKRSVCCFGGLNWLTKDHPQCDTWLALPGAKK